MLSGMFFRRGHIVLKESLPMKTEHVLFVRMTEVQRTLYRRFMEELISNRYPTPGLDKKREIYPVFRIPDKKLDGSGSGALYPHTGLRIRIRIRIMHFSSLASRNPTKKNYFFCLKNFSIYLL